MFSLSSPPHSLNKWYLQCLELSLDVAYYRTFSPNLNEFCNRTHHPPAFPILKKIHCPWFSFKHSDNQASVIGQRFD